jgi:hypothetical protein
VRVDQPSQGPFADPEIHEAELHPEARLAYIQRRMQEEEGVRLTIDNILYVLRLNEDFEAKCGRGSGA